jgi:hypothetical protein
MLRLSKGKVLQHFRGSRGIQPVAEFLASPKQDCRFLGDIDGRAGARVAANPCRAMAQGKPAEAAQLHPTASGEMRRNLLEDRVHDLFDICQPEVGIVLRHLSDEFAPDHSLHRRNSMGCII